jgi:hypothetical protein
VLQSISPLLRWHQRVASCKKSGTTDGRHVTHVKLIADIHHGFFPIGVKLDRCISFDARACGYATVATFMRNETNSADPTAHLCALTGGDYHAYMH